MLVAGTVGLEAAYLHAYWHFFHGRPQAFLWEAVRLGVPCLIHDVLFLFID